MKVYVTVAGTYNFTGVDETVAVGDVRDCSVGVAFGLIASGVVREANSDDITTAMASGRAK